MFELLDKRIQKLIEKKGFSGPTLPQALSLKPILEGKNLLIIAPTGVGKTESIILPIFHKLLQKKHKPISVLYITPLKSLNRDMLDRMFWWADKLDLEVAVRHGDTSTSERAAQREMPSDLFIVTPETLGAILIGKKMREHLKNVKFVVIDEIHEIVENKRGVQLSLLLERLERLAGSFQRIGLSATVGDPRKVSAFLGKNVKTVNAASAKVYEINVELPLPKEEHKSLASELFIEENTTARLLRLRELILKRRSVLTFTNTRETAEVLSSRFRVIDKELKQEVHHGSLSKESRIQSEKKFKKEELKALIATSSLELGIDIGSIDLVVQYLSPRQVSRLIQRIGRSGHKVGEKSKGVIITGDEDVFEASVIARRAMAKDIENIKIHEMSMDVLAAQIVGLGLEEYNINSNTVYNTLKNAYPFRNLSKERFLETLRFIGSLRLFWLNPIKDKEDEYEIRRNRRSWEYYYSNLTTIPDTRQMRIISVVENEPIGKLDEMFVAEHGKTGNTFVCKGRAWRIIQVDGNKVIVEPVDDIESAIPAWEGELIPVPYEISQEVGKIRKMIAEEKKKNISGKLMNLYNIDMNAAEEMIQLIEKQKKFGIPDHENFILETYKDFIILHSCCGTLINDTIGRYVSALLTSESGVAVNLKVDPYRIIFQTVAKLQDIKRILENAEKVKEMLNLALERSSLFKWRFLNIAKKFGIISKDARYDMINVPKIMAEYSDSPAHTEAMREVFLDKLDVEGAEDVLKRIKNGQIKLHIIKGLSILGENGLVKQFSDVMKPKMPKEEIFTAFKKRLMCTPLRLVCTNCADFTILQEVRSMDTQPTCPKCQSGLIGIRSRFKHRPLNIIKKGKKKKPLTAAEKKELEEINRSASLMITYGKKYGMVQAGRGIGVETAARVLARIPKNEEQLLKYIYEAEKNYARTRIYWKA